MVSSNCSVNGHVRGVSSLRGLSVHTGKHLHAFTEGCERVSTMWERMKDRRVSRRKYNVIKGERVNMSLEMCAQFSQSIRSESFKRFFSLPFSSSAILFLMSVLSFFASLLPHSLNSLSSSGLTVQGPLFLASEEGDSLTLRDLAVIEN